MFGKLKVHPHAVFNAFFSPFGHHRIDPRRPSSCPILLRSPALEALFSSIRNEKTHLSVRSACQFSKLNFSRSSRNRERNRHPDNDVLKRTITGGVAPKKGLHVPGRQAGDAAIHPRRLRESREHHQREWSKLPPLPPSRKPSPP